MTREQALYELMEVATTAIAAAFPDEPSGPELFYWAEMFRNDAAADRTQIEGQCSEEFRRIDEHQRAVYGYTSVPSSSQSEPSA